MPQDRRRVVWFEGMTLDPHHFQQWDRYYHSTLNARVRALARYDWGLTALEVDRERLANGELRLVRCSGVLPDGLVFDVPDDDEPPVPRNLQDYFPATQERLAVYLATPVERHDGGNFLLQDGEARRETRYRAETISVPDENTGADIRPVEVARSTFSIRFGGEPLQAYTTVQVAAVRRSPDGTFVLDETFIPTCLTLSASERLQGLTRRLLELLVTKSGSLMERHRGAARQREVSPSDVQALGLLGVVNGFIPLLNHYHTHPESHPEALFKTLLALAGQLTAYLPEAGVSPRQLPTYDHGNLSDCFNRLDEQLRGMLGGATPTANYVQVPLQRQRENLYTATLDGDLLQKAQFFLVARSPEVPEEKLVRELPVMLRVASPETIEAVLRSYTRALGVEHTHRLPSALPVDAQANYFQLQKRGPFWEAITEERALAIFVPGEFSQVDMTLVAVQS
ncbi:type VI secretion system baseplate subunit TssK [Rhodocaloribacter litoris]|uniref:type VI secretion system baseplate subunit TssK n=1 Tax=Rhodocaloribacter litoris TaxID=2558931 RepID=UPI0014242352|nr:type VI secretion system baseplate subunit TssK [Rhodocaloribacter litoris]QXD13865.1 type VI secretion system baseplate subunit TssK [Rhodocaloribacter litoris]